MNAPRDLWTILARAEALHGERSAVLEGERAWTYADLARRVRARAAQWRALGLAPGARVALLDWNTATFLESYFAAAGLGAILCPLNHRLAAAELAEILRDAGAGLLVAGRGFARLVEDLSAHATPLRQVLWSEDPPPASHAAFEPSSLAPADVAQLYYTSGTTGRAKGVMLTHGNVSTHAEWAVRELALTSRDRWGHFAPMFHLADAWAIFALTLVGGAHVMVPRFEPEGALAALERHGITLTNLIPTMLKRLVEHPGVRRERCASLRLLLSGGAPIAPALVRQVLDTLGCEYAQTYGMTETSPYLTLGLLPEALRRLPPDEVLRLRARTGRPFGSIELEVVDERGTPVPNDDCTVGEIRVRGATVTPGYWNRPEETAQALRSGWLYTGDLAVVDVHGFVNIVDRRKDMILTGGENVYSTEVENALYEHPAVLEAAVFARPDETYGESVNAAVVLKEGQAPSAAELVAFCRARIAGYKVPRTIEFLPELPKTGSGKISKQALRTAKKGP
jgi:acyl-CoA synthetase (AMP-forming)/AMP-acid ligase II